MKVESHYFQDVWKTIDDNRGVAIALTGVAIIVVHVFGRVAVTGFGLIALGAYITFGRSWKVMSFFDLKGFAVVAVLFGNSYFGIINAHLLNGYAGACMAVREWNFWNIHSELSKQCDDLKSHNDSMRTMLEDWKVIIGNIETRLNGLQQRAAAAVPAREQLATNRSALEEQVNQEWEAITRRLTTLGEIAEGVMSDEALRRKVEYVAGLHRDVASLEAQQQAVRKKFEDCTTELRSLNGELGRAIELFNNEETIKRAQIQELTTILDRLRNVQRRSDA